MIADEWEPTAAVSEITNTPWLERHSYVTDQRPDPSAP